MHNILLLIITCVSFIGISPPIVLAESIPDNNFKVHKMSPYKDLEIIAIDLDRNWTLNGTNWYKHLWKSTVGNETRTSYSTCHEQYQSYPNKLTSPIIDSTALPSHRLPAVIQANFSLHISETCKRVGRFNCLAGLEIWSSENNGEIVHKVFDGLEPPLKSVYRKKYISNRTESHVEMDEISIAFRINQLPFNLEFVDVRGACFELREAKMISMSCRMVQVSTKKTFKGLMMKTTEEPSTKNNFSLSNSTHTKTLANHLSELQCLCPPGFHLSNGKHFFKASK